MASEAPEIHQPAFKFCPGCGAARTFPTSEDPADAFSTDASSSAPIHFPHQKQLSCRLCGFTLFLNAATAVMGLLSVDGAKIGQPAGQRFLLTAIRAHDPAAFMLDMPGGFVDPGESCEQALLRELEEEVGGLALRGTEAEHEPTTLVRVGMQDLSYLCSNANIYHYRHVKYHPCDFSYVADLTPQISGSLPEFQGRDDVLGLIWLSSSDLKDVIEGKAAEVEERWKGRCDPRTKM